MHRGEKEVFEAQENNLEKWIRNCEVLFTEVPYDVFPEENMLAGKTGTEVIVKKIITSQNLKIDKNHFEENSFQLSTLIPAPNILHNYTFCKEVPYFAIPAKYVSWFFYFPVLIKRYIEAMKQSEETEKNIIDSYKNGEVKETSLLVNRSLFMRERNCSWIKSIVEQPLDKKTLYVVGAAHLPGVDGMIDLLEQQGYICEAIDLASDPKSPSSLPQSKHVKIKDEQRAYYHAIKPKDWDGFYDASEYSLVACIATAWHNVHARSKNIVKKEKFKQSLIEISKEKKVSEGPAVIENLIKKDDEKAKRMTNTTFLEIVKKYPHAIKKIFLQKKSIKKYPRMYGLALLSIGLRLTGYAYSSTIPENPYSQKP